MAVQIVHCVVFFADPGGLLRIQGLQHLLCAAAQFDCDSAHLGEVTVYLLGQRVLRVAAAGDLGDVQREGAHPVDIGDDLDAADDGAQIAGNRTLQGKQQESGFLGATADLGDAVVVGDDLLGECQVGLQQGLGRAFHRHAGQPAHLAELNGQGRQLFLIRSTHVITLRSAGQKVTMPQMNER